MLIVHLISVSVLITNISSALSISTEVEYLGLAPDAVVALVAALLATVDSSGLVRLRYKCLVRVFACDSVGNFSELGLLLAAFDAGFVVPLRSLIWHIFMSMVDVCVAICF